VDHETYLAHIVEHADAMRAAAVTAGPDAHVPTCPKWNVHQLITHIGRVHAWVRIVLKTDLDAGRPPLPEAPEGWDQALDWWDEQRNAMVTELAADPDAPMYVFSNATGATARWWSRRQAHETAIHRLDAEHALSAEVPTLVYDSELAADGIDEVLTVLSPFRAPEPAVEGDLLVHAADAGRTWMLHVRKGQPLQAGPIEDSAIDADATLVGTADAVYRAVWKRPSTAITTGNPDLLQAIKAG
jgi:uncharacterized protein (TIGR03083 family)